MWFQNNKDQHRKTKPPDVEQKVVLAKTKRNLNFTSHNNLFWHVPTVDYFSRRTSEMYGVTVLVTSQDTEWCISKSVIFFFK